MANTATVLDILAHNYLTGSHTEPRDDEKKAFTDWILNEYFNLPVRVKFVAAEVSPETMLHFFKYDQMLYISTLHSEHPFLTPMQNWMFRAVHDFHHASQDLGFDLDGEVATARYAISTAPKSIHWMLWSEISLQAAASIKTGEFQPQKMVHCYF